ncbi:MAG TPA: EAL domain-containing protein [Fontimonas sp.]
MPATLQSVAAAAAETQPQIEALQRVNELILDSPLSQALGVSHFAFGIQVGALFTLALFIVMIAVTRPDERSTPWLAASSGLFGFTLLGWYIASQPDQGGLSPLLLTILRYPGVLAVITLVEFARRFLHLRQHALRLLKLIRYWEMAAIPALVLATALQDAQSAVLGVYKLAGLALLAATAIVRLRQREWLAAPVLIALLVLVAGALPSMHWWFDPSDNVAPLLRLGAFSASSTIAIMLLGMGIALRLYRLRVGRLAELELAIGHQRLALSQARTDRVTRLLDQVQFSEQMQARLQTLKGESNAYAIISISLHSFRPVRHGLNPASAEAGMAELAMRMRQSAQPADLLARIGPENFLWGTAVRPGREGVTDLTARCAAMRSHLNAPLANANGVMVTCDFGIALVPEHGVDIGLLIRRSDEALLRTEKDAKQEIRYFHDEMQQESHHTMHLTKELRRALLRNEVELYYQPQIHLARGDIVGAEALIRWNRNGRLLPPSEFVPIAESSDLIVHLGEWALDRACQQLADWHRAGLVLPHVSVNVAAAQFHHAEFTAQVTRALDKAGLPGNRLILEITESMALNNLDQTAALLDALLKLGVSASMDDFGVGYSSLSYLRKLPVRAIKIDRSFLQGIPGDAEAKAVVSTIISLGRDLGLDIVAEGIETVPQQVFLSERGVETGQGYLISKPLRASDFELWARRNQASRRAAARV